MRELKIVEKQGIFKDIDVRAFIIEPGDSLSVDEEGITRDKFLSILDKASQPIDREAKSDSETSET